MKNLIIIIITLFVSFQPVFAFGNNTDLLTKIENDVFGFDYNKDSTQNRVTRLEKTIYGKISSGDISKRIKRLGDDLCADVMGLEIEPVKDTFLAEENAKEEAGVDYPIVNEIEQKLFNKTYKERDFHTRIVTIEKKLFGKIYDVDDYSTRMDRIKSKIMPETVAQKEYEPNYSDGSYYNDDMINSMDFSSKRRNLFTNPFGQRNLTRSYANYGDFGEFGRDSSPKNLEDELTQLEYDTFGTEFSNEDTHTRIKRLNSVNKAKKSSKKYDSQKFSQHMSTAMEIGAMILMILAMVL